MKVFDLVKVTTPKGEKFIPKVAIIEGVIVGVTFVNKRKDGSWNIQYKPYFNSTLVPEQAKLEIQNIGTNFTLAQIEKYKQYMFKPGENPGGYFVEEVKKTYPKKHNSEQTQTCWECGCTFTYAQCKRDGGDWNESYCGC